MPRIVPIQLLKCLKVLLNDNGGILSTGEVRRIACLMSKYSKKLVSKCIYVQILKCTDTELLGEFMSVGGWNLVHGWLSDGIRLMNWPLVQEILELLLLCPVDVNRLKINTAPKLVKGLCAGGGNEGVRILAKRLVEQWLKIVTEGNEVQQQQTSVAQVSQQTDTKSLQNDTAAPKITISKKGSTSTEKPVKIEHSSDAEEEDDNEEEDEEDPLALPGDETVVPKNLTPTPAQKKASKTGLVYKIVVKNGHQLLTKVEPKDTSDDVPDGENEEIKENESIIEEEEDAAVELVGEDSSSLDKTEDKEGSESSVDEKKSDEKKRTEIKSKEKSESKDERDQKNKDSKSKEYRSEKVKDKEKEKDKDKDRKSSSSSHRSSSSSHKSSSKNSSSSSSSKSKSSSSSSSSPSTSHRSSSDKHRSDKERSSSSSSSSKDKDRSSSSSSSNKHRSSSSKSSSSSSKDRHREKDKDKSTSSSVSSSLSSKKDKEREKELQVEKDKDTLAKMLPPSLDKLGKIPKKPKDEKEDVNSSNNPSNKPTSITIPSKKASMSIEIRRDTEKASTVKTYKSQFRSHGLTEEAPPPPSRKTLKKPTSSASQPGTVIPTSLPSSLKRASPPPRESPTEKKLKIDINSITPAAANVEKPGAIKLIPAKRIQTLVETNIFSDALSAATGPKKVIKRKRPANAHKDDPATPTSPDAPKVAPLKFYQDTLDESAKAGNDDKSKDDVVNNNNADGDKDNSVIVTDEDDDIPLKKVKEDIEQRVRKEKAAAAGEVIEIRSEDDDAEKTDENASSTVEEVRKPGPGCGPDGPPGVLMLHRRKGPKKKLTWRPHDQLEQIRYFELDENERVNVMKVSFHDMKNMERFNERASLTNLTKRGPRPGDNQEPRTEWRPLIEVDDVPLHPDGAQSKERKVQADREMTTLRALYFSPNMIPDSPSEAEIEPHYPGDPPTIPLDDITGNQDAINDFSGMPWPEPKGSPKHGDNSISGTGGLGGLGNPTAEMFPVVLPNNPANMKNPFNNNNNNNNNNNFMSPFSGNSGPGPLSGPQQIPMVMSNSWQGPPKNVPVNMMGNNNAFQNHPNVDMMSGGPNFMSQHGQFNGPPPFMQGRNQPFGPPPGFNGPNFGSMGPNGPMGQMGNNMGGGPMPLMSALNNGPRGGNNMRNNGSNWINGPNNFQENNMNNNGGWRPAGTGPNRTGHNNMSGNNGVCKAFVRGNCRLGKSCKYIHPKGKRL